MRTKFQFYPSPGKIRRPLVLTPETNNRLALVNAVIRRIRGLGFGIVDISPANRDTEPVISISVDPEQSAEPLFSVATPGSLYRSGEVVSIRIDGVRVLWVRPELLAAMTGK